MKTKMSCIFVLLAIIFIIPSPVYANSAPLDNRGMQSAEMLLLDEQCPITVESEALVFDFRAQEEGSCTGGTISASYNMHNPTEEVLTVRMAFPFINSPIYVHAEEISISCDGEYLPWEYYCSDNFIQRGDLSDEDVMTELSIQNVLETINSETSPYEPTNFDLDKEGFLYRYTNADPNDFKIKLDRAVETKIILDNMYEFSTRDEPNLHILNAFYTESTCSFFSLDGAIEYAATGTYTESTESMTLREYLETERSEFYISHGYRIENLESYWLSKLDECARYTYIRDSLLVSDGDWDIYFNMMVYEVTFPAGATRTVTIEYPTYVFLSGGGYSGKATMYTQVYLSNPAHYWASFQNLTVTVLLPEFAPNLYNTALPFEKDADGVYKMHLDELPENNVTFSFSSTNKRTGISMGEYFLLLVILFIAPPIVINIKCVWPRRKPV